MSLAMVATYWSFTDDIGSSSKGESVEANFVKDELKKIQDQFDSYTIGRRAVDSFNHLYQVFMECRNPNWDGYGAHAVSDDTFQLAYNFLTSLPLGTPPPSFGAEPDGDITIEWYQSPRKTLSVSISPNGELHYAALIGSRKNYGTEPFFGEVPEAVIDLIRKVSPHD